MARSDLNYYAACDRAIKAMNRDILRDFGQLKLAKWDEIHLIQTVTTVYQRSARKAREQYYEVAFEAYLLGLELCGFNRKRAYEVAENAITSEWVDWFLSEIDPVPGYRFTTETERKAQRLAETLEVAAYRNQEIDRAVRLWSKQFGQFAIDCTDSAVVQAFTDAGVEEVIWDSVPDERRCAECAALDGKVFKIDEIPIKPHLGCRCRLRPVLKSD